MLVLLRLLVSDISRHPMVASAKWLAIAVAALELLGSLTTGSISSLILAVRFLK